MTGWLPGVVARVRASIHTKLLVAFLLIVAMMLAAGAVGLGALREVNRRTEDMVQFQRKIAAYRQLNHDTIGQLYGVASALLKPDDRKLAATLRQLNQFGYDLDRLQFVAQDEKDLFRRVRADYEEFISVVTQVIELIRNGRVGDGQALQLSRATPLADGLERLTNELVNKAEADMVASIEASHDAYTASQRAVIGFAIASILLALLLGHTVSSSIIVPVKQMEARMHEIAGGNFDARLLVLNRDELGVLASDLNRMSNELGRVYGELEAASRHKSEFLANMSHELRTPLNAIIGFSDVLNTRMFGELNGKQMEYVRDIYASGHHLLSLINDILDLSKVEAGRMELNVTQFDLPAAIDSATTLVRERATRNEISLRLEIDKRLNAFAGDERKFKQILLNLLSNAVGFTAAGGTVAVFAHPIDAGVQLAVRDTGIGIAPHDQDKIFEAFHQVGGDFASRRDGTGLGLTLARRFVAMHGGRLWVESEPGKGSTFSFTLKAQPWSTV